MTKFFINIITGIFVTSSTIAIATLAYSFIWWKAPTIDWQTIRLTIVIGTIAGPLFIGGWFNKWAEIYD